GIAIFSFERGEKRWLEAFTGKDILPMGKCLSCLRIDPVPQQHQQQRSQYQQHSTIHLMHNCHRTPSIQDCESYKDASESGSSVGCIESRSPVIPVDSQSNGSSKASNITITMPEKRSFYSRIPPLAKSASNEIRRVSSKECNETKIIILFEQYKDENCDAILAEGIVKLCLDLDVKPDDFKVLLLAWKFGAETMCKFTREEFVNGCKLLKADSVKGIQLKFNDLILEVQNPDKFKDLYRFTFKFGLDSESGQRILPVDISILLWKLVFTLKEPSILNRWIQFLEQHPSIRGISRDTWYMFLNFAETVADDLSLYDDTEAWPSLLDDFVEHENDKLNQNISKEQKDEEQIS
ncbi:DCN1-like protein 3, partial [Armadillidium nasatum]